MRGAHIELTPYPARIERQLAVSGTLGTMRYPETKRPSAVSVQAHSTSSSSAHSTFNTPEHNRGWLGAGACSTRRILWLESSLLIDPSLAFPNETGSSTRKIDFSSVGRRTAPAHFSPGSAALLGALRWRNRRAEQRRSG